MLYLLFLPFGLTVLPPTARDDLTESQTGTRFKKLLFTFRAVEETDKTLQGISIAIAVGGPLEVEDHSLLLITQCTSDTGSSGS